MKYDIDKNEYGFDTAISASDWKYSAAITGLIYYFKELEKKYEIKKITIDEITDSYLLYNKENINEENYLDFIEKFYSKYSEDTSFFFSFRNRGGISSRVTFSSDNGPSI